MLETKRCCACKEIKPVTDFYNKHYRCKRCDITLRDPVKHAARNRRSARKLRATDPLAYKKRRQDAHRKYKARHPEKYKGKPTPEMLEHYFWARVDKTGGEQACWPWLGSRTRAGYGEVQYGGVKWLTHRLAFSLVKGALRYCVCHHCDNPICCNPSHLFDGTPADNAHDSARKLRKARKLKAEAVRAIRAEYAAGGVSQRALALRYGVAQHTIMSVVNRQIWAHLE